MRDETPVEGNWLRIGVPSVMSNGMRICCGVVLLTPFSNCAPAGLGVIVTPGSVAKLPVKLPTWMPSDWKDCWLNPSITTQKRR